MHWKALWKFITVPHMTAALGIWRLIRISHKLILTSRWRQNTSCTASFSTQADTYYSYYSFSEPLNIITSFKDQTHPVHTVLDFTDRRDPCSWRSSGTAGCCGPARWSSALPRRHGRCRRWRSPGRPCQRTPAGSSSAPGQRKWSRHIEKRR